MTGAIPVDTGRINIPKDGSNPDIVMNEKTSRAGKTEI
jgi:hypothetical protein